jgi:hypothetical protein
MRQDTWPSSRRHTTSEESARYVDQATALGAGRRRRRIGARAEDRHRRDFSRAGSRGSTHDHEPNRSLRRTAAAAPYRGRRATQISVLALEPAGFSDSNVRGRRTERPPACRPRKTRLRLGSPRKWDRQQRCVVRVQDPRRGLITFQRAGLEARRSRSGEPRQEPWRVPTAPARDAASRRTAVRVELFYPIEAIHASASPDDLGHDQMSTWRGGDERGRLALASLGLTRVRNGGLNRLGALGDRPV